MIAHGMQRQSSLKVFARSGAGLALLALAGQAGAALVVTSPQPITHEVVIQPIRVHKADGTTANFFGSPSSEDYIKEQIDSAWAQLGIRISWLPVTEYTNDFAFDGSPGNYSSSSRPQSHLNSLVDGAPTPPKSANAIVMNMFFVGIVPGFPQTSANTSNGLAFIDSNGSAIHVGTNLLTWNGGRDVIAGVVGHEIGHNLGLAHYQSSNTNLMYSGGSTADYLVASQGTTVFTNNGGTDGFDFLQPLPPPTNYDLWASAYGLSGGPEGDDDGDRLSNGFEFLYGSPPHIWSAFPAPAATADGPVWTLGKQADAVADGFDYAVLCGPDPATWNPAGAPGSCSTVLQDDDSATSVRLDTSHSRAFLKVDVVVPPAAASALMIPPDPNPGPRTLSACSEHGGGCRSAVRP